MRKLTNAELYRPSVDEVAVASKMPVTVILEDIRSMNNVGSFFRTCDAFGVERLVLCGITGTPPAREIHKTALGAENTVAWEYYPSAREAVEHLRSQEYHILAVEQAEGAVMLDDFRLVEDVKYGMIFGNEVDGVRQETIDLCDGAVEIPQVGTKHSLNVAVSGGAVLWSLFCQSRKLL